LTSILRNGHFQIIKCSFADTQFPTYHFGGNAGFLFFNSSHYLDLSEFVFFIIDF